MPEICYIEKEFKAETMKTIEQANEIISDYRAQGFVLTLRQLYYQFVARDLIPNTMRSYKRLGSIVNDARLAGLIDWEAIEDRTRNLRGLSHWDNPGEIIHSAAYSYRLDKWEDQPHRVEVWIEKEALAGVFERVCNREDVSFFCCRGYVSQSEQWSAAQRLESYISAGQEPIVLHFGDHDPSGLDMSRDIRERFDLFAGRHEVQVRRLALNMDQIEQYSPPPNPAKVTDSRYDGYQRQYGEESWELDALEPRILEALVTSEIAKLRDDDLWAARVADEQAGRERLEYLAKNWESV